jgi:hypothetical protein
VIRSTSSFRSFLQALISRTRDSTDIDSTVSWLLWTELLGDRPTPLSSERPDYCQYPVVLGVCRANGAGLLDPGGLRQTAPLAPCTLSCRPF